MASGQVEGSAAFAQRHGIERGFGSCEQQSAADTDIAVYTATMHPHHTAAWCAAGLTAGKHAVIEKPLALNVTEFSSA